MPARCGRAYISYAEMYAAAALSRAEQKDGFAVMVIIRVTYRDKIFQLLERCLQLTVIQKTTYSFRIRNIVPAFRAARLPAASRYRCLQLFFISINIKNQL